MCLTIGTTREIVSNAEKVFGHEIIFELIFIGPI